MTPFESAMLKVKPIALVEPGPNVREILQARAAQRYTGKDILKPIIVESPTDSKTRMGKRLCAWCNVKPITRDHWAAKYCSPDCRQSADFFCHPQSPDAKAWILINRQSCACAGCGTSYEEYVTAKILRKYDDWNEGEKKPKPITFFGIGYSTGHVWHVDHIVPLFKGGAGIGLDNVQVLCVPCHHKKTAEERRS